MIQVFGSPTTHADKRTRFGVLEYRTVMGQGHGCEKPLTMMKVLVQSYARLGMPVLDPFMGSGTTGVACMQTGRNFIGIEIDPGYFEIAKKRIEEAQLQPCLPLWASDGCVR